MDNPDTPAIPLPSDTTPASVPDSQRIENIFGMLLRVTTAPTWTPRSFYEGMAVDTTNNRFYWYDFTNAAWKYTTHALTLEALLTPGTSGNVITSNGSSWVSQAPADPTLVTVTAGETLTAGEVVRLYTAVGNYTSDGYNFTNGLTYACRAAADDTTYGPSVYGIVYENMTYLGTGRVKVTGEATVSGVTANSKLFLDNRSAASSNTISQTSQDAEQQLSAGVTVIQLWQPTESRSDKLVVKARKNGGGACSLTCVVKRHNATLATTSVDLGANSATLAEFTLDHTDFLTYKGETLTLNFTTDTGFGYIGYKSGGSVYNGGASGGSIPANSDIYMKAYEYTNFGKLNTTAGTRKIKVGQSGDATTKLNIQIQLADAIL